jgi:molybdopterin/thiamine biosynthesis adenylyltransferase
MERFDRQIRVFGHTGQQTLQKLLIGLVGSGGIGSVLFVLLVRLGVLRFVVVEPDIVEETNLNRLATSTVEDVKNRTFKVDMLARYAAKINPKVRVTRLRKSIMEESVQRRLRPCDVIFGGTDTESSRDVLNLFSVRYHIPYFDVGTGIQADSKQHIEHAGGQVRIVIPGMGCLRCIQGIDLAVAQQEQLPEPQRQIAVQRGYIAGADVPAPAVASLNGVVANLAVTELMAFATGFKPLQRYLYYDFMRGIVAPVQFDRDPACFICSPAGSFGVGDTALPLPPDMPIELGAHGVDNS